MTLEQLHTIVRANFGCKNPKEKILRQVATQGNPQLPMFFFANLAREYGYTEEQIAEFLDTTPPHVERMLDGWAKTEEEMGKQPFDGWLHIKNKLIRNAITLRKETKKEASRKRMFQSSYAWVFDTKKLSVHIF